MCPQLVMLLLKQVFMMAGHFGNVSTETHLNCWVMLHTGCRGSYAASDSNSGWFVRWTVRGDLIDFVITAQTFGWVGIGFSADTAMVRRLPACKLCIQKMAKGPMNEGRTTSRSHGSEQVRPSCKWE